MYQKSSSEFRSELSVIILAELASKRRALDAPFGGAAGYSNLVPINEVATEGLRRSRGMTPGAAGV
jgi:hypothetical protein